MTIRLLGRSAAALAAAGALVLTGCSSPDAPSKADASAIVTTNGSEPQNPLVPTNTNEAGGGKIIDAVFSGLLAYQADGRPVNDVARSIETSDSQHFVITINEDRTFSNGEKVTSRSFVDAWNHGAKKSNAQLLNSFFEDIEGFSGDEDTELSGLTVVSDTEFTVDLKTPVSDFPLRLGFSAFYPLPSVAFEDMTAFGAHPIGNGPYKLAGDTAWKHDESIDLVANPAYTGPRTAKNGGLRIVFYASLESAYADLRSGTLDVLDAIPDTELATFEKDLDGRAVNQPAAVFQNFAIPERIAHFAGEEGRLRREAISLAIDRAEITKVIFDGTRTPAKDFTSPVIPGWSGKLAGAGVLDHDAKKAKKLWADADKLSPWTGTFAIAYNADGGHKAWVDAVANNLKNTLGVDAKGEASPTFAQLRTSITERTIDSAFRAGWQGDYPGLLTFLRPVYGTGALSNDSEYANPEFDALLAKGLAEPDVEAADAEFRAAQELLLRDLPAIPLWYQNVTGGYSEAVSDVRFGWNSVPLYEQIIKKSAH
ncbi:peptide ABC transporter substrate-binding protein [Leifsonia shinshuensis]|uniref:ABC transporter substrate-binding protein n=1 Tax=Leifsonia shinshuensis TaxID=150026 RepID=A0A7G6Y5P9_9MICO|nr:ABC transporter substrate-binding protein [Leifsonia shinshuensis]QNE33814.1 ABC transporter substrate-binding protein [Leifsonia shinshuensis]